MAGYTYTYDGDGNRVIKSGTNSRMYWTDPGGTVLSETDLSGNNRVRDVYFGNKLIARKDASGSIHYLVQDQLGSERVSVSASGTVEDDMDTYPWGGHAPHYASSSGNIYTFTGDENDAESTSFNTPFRQLSSTLGRWLRPDPYDGSYDPTNPQSLNRYSYVLNNPPSLIDPSGLDGCVMGQGGIGTESCATVCAKGCHDQYGNYYTLNRGVPVLTIQDYPSNPGLLHPGYIPPTNGTGGYYIPGPAPMGSYNYAGNANSANGPAPSNCRSVLSTCTKSQKVKQCMDKLNNSPDGKFNDFFSLLSPFIGPDASAGEVLKDVSKESFWKFVKTAATTMKGSPLGKVSSITSGLKEAYDATLAPVVAGATVAQLLQYGVCHVVQ